MKPTATYLIQLNPLLKEKGDVEIQDLISAFYESGYDWDDEQKFFFNEDLDMCIKVSSLNSFRPQDIRECWGNKDYLKEQGQLKVLTKIGCCSILVVPIAILICFIYNWKFGIGLAVIAVITLLISDKIKRGVLTQRQKREGTWIDKKKIQWCKNCRHYRKIKGWEDSANGLWSRESIPEQGNLPCRIIQETMDIWHAYYSLERNHRTLYPKECPKIEMNS
jgi:hypothetical protein